MSAETRVLLIAAPFYEDITEQLVAGAKGACESAGVNAEVVEVPGALEIPAVIALAEQGKSPFEAYVALGCVIRGETTHYETVCNESARALVDLSIADNLAIGNGILTVENEDQAWARADHRRKDKGGGAAEAAMAMAGLRAGFGIDG